MTRHGMYRLLGALIGLVAMGLASIAAYAEARWDRVFEAPIPEVTASSDPEVIERGRYLVFGPAHCAACHIPLEQVETVATGVEVPLVGGYEWRLPLGVIRSPNITPDHETGIGRYSDGEIARILRHGVRPDGRAAFPFMEFQNIAESDLLAIISYLRSVPGVRNEVPTTELNLLGRGIMATLIRPVGPTGEPPAEAPAGTNSLERGAYLVNNVANCASCHSARNLVDGSYTGPRLAGGNPMPIDDDPSIVLVPPNLTPDEATGHLHGWTAEAFIARFRAGAIRKGSHMPWTLYARMSDEDLTAVYLYLESVDPVHNDTGPIQRAAD